jgi:CRISPR type I-E-associated protein CasB/Cse2
MEKEERIDRFLDQLRQYMARKQRGPLADLRRGFSKAGENRTWPYLASWCDLTNKSQRAIWQTVAAGFATLEASSQIGNLGHTMRLLATGVRRQKGEQSDALKSFEGRFRRLLTCRTAQEVCERLPGIIRACKNKGVGLDFQRLYWDLVSWNSDKHDVRIEWAAAFWGVGWETPS